MARNLPRNTQAPLFDIATDASLMHSILSMPKIDLHRHLSGSIDAEAVIRIAAKYEVKLPTYISSELQSILSNRHEVDTLKKYFTPWSILNKLYVSTEAIHDLILEAVRKAAQDNVIYVEFRTSPQGFLGANPFTFEEYAQTISSAIAEAESKFDITIRFILGIPRHVFGRIPMQSRNKMFARIIDIISPFRSHCFVGVDLNGDEAAVDAEGFEYFFRAAQDRDFNITVHAGECGPSSNVEYAVKNLHASRIGHGIAAAKDISLLSTLAERNCTLEICPTSNEILGVVSRTEDLPLKILREYGVQFVICSDNPARCRTSLSEELFKTSKAFALSESDIGEIAYSSLVHSFADESTKNELKSKMVKKLKKAEMCFA